MSLTTKNWFLYVLQLENNCFYIGITVDFKRRLKEHQKGKGYNFTRSHKVINVIEFTSCETSNTAVAGKMEDFKTLEYAIKHGSDKVFGGGFGKNLTLVVNRFKKTQISSSLNF